MEWICTGSLWAAFVAAVYFFKIRPFLGKEIVESVTPRLDPMMVAGNARRAGHYARGRSDPGILVSSVSIHHVLYVVPVCRI